MALTKVSGGILDPGISVAGIVTATGFSGPFIGGGGVNAGIVTATGLDVNGNGDISGTLVVGNIGGTPTFTGDVNFNGNVSIAQTLTYSDVTNIDSVGIVTARQGIRVTADGSTSANYISVGASNDFKIYHTGNHTHLDNDTGHITVTANQINLNNQDNSENCLQCIGNAEVRLFHNGVNKFQTTSYGAIVDPVSHYNSQSASPARLSLGGSFSNTSAITTKPKLTLWEDSSNNDAMGFQITASLLSVHLSKTSYDFAIKAAGNTLLTVDSGNNETNYSADHDLNLNASTNKSGIIRFNNYAPTAAGPNKIILWESSSPDWSGGFGVSSNHIDYYSGHTHRFYTGTTTSSVGNVAAKFIKDGAAELYHNGSKKLVTASNGIDITGMCTDDGARHDGDVYFIGGTSGRNAVWDMSDNALEFADNAKAVFGTDSDLEIFNDGGTLSFIRNNNGKLVLRSDTFQFGTQDGAHRYIDIPDDEQGVSLFYDNNKKLETKGYGIDITGGFITTGGSIVQDGGNIKFGTGSDLQIFHDNSNNINVIQCHNGRTLHIDKNNGAENMAKFIPDGAVELYYDDGKKLETNTDGVQVTGSTGSFLKIRTSGGYDSGLVLTVNNNDSTDWSMRNDESDSNKLDFRYDGTRKMHLTSSGDLHLTGEVAASQDYPNFRPTLDFNFAAEKKLDPRITYQRTGVASFTDEFGLVKIVGDNAPRFDHDPITRESKGLLSEPTRTNLLKYSVDFASISGYNPNYSGARSTLTSTTELAPDGTNTASKYVRTAGQGTGEVAIIIGNTLGLNNTSVYTSSIFVKNVGNYSTVEMVNTRASDVNDDSQFNLSTGTITTEGSNNSLTTITPYPNDWYRISVTATHNNLSGYFWVRIYNQTEGSGFMLWGGQVEVGRYPTSYIPTYNNASVTRGEDLVLIDGTEFTDFFNTTEGTSVVHAHMPYSSTSYGLTAYSFKNSSNSNVSLSFSRDSNASPAYHYYHDGTNSGLVRASANTSNMYKGALSFKTSDLDSYVNGSLNTNTTTFTMPTVDNLRIGGVGSENQLGGHVARFMYYPVKLTNNQLATLTS